MCYSVERATITDVCGGGRDPPYCGAIERLSFQIGACVKDDEALYLGPLSDW